MSPHHDAGKPASPTDNKPIQRGKVFATVSLALLMTSVDSTIVATALHSMQLGLHTSINWVGWTITAYSFGFVLMLPISGGLSERYGRRKVFLGSIIAFTAASLCCGLTNDIFLLIALRAVQAAGGAGFTPSATGIVVDHFGSARDRAVSLFGSIFPIGAMIGPIFGGLFVTYWTWRGVFFVNVPIGLLLMAMTLRYIPRDRPAQPAGAAGNPSTAKKPRRGLDIVGITLLGGGLFAAMLAASYLGEKHAEPASLAFVAPAIVAVAGLWLFFRHIHRSTHPFIAPQLIHGPGFGSVNFINTIYGGIIAGSMALVPLYATNRYGIDALGSGTLLVAQGIAAIVLSIVGTMILRRTGYRLPMYIGGTVIGLGMLLLAIHPPAGISPYLWMAAAAFLVGAGSGTLNPASRNAGLQLAPEHSSTLAALRTLFRQVGSIITISTATAILSHAGTPGSTQSWIYIATALLCVASLPVITRVPEHRGSW
ncbi:MFS transporter [Candidimonas nitroreducens]|uniref:MFS transporter n=1 Tax=Candidimonas nitroreducens TaxID=683354 RepID=A0A225MKG1_9BURK|nr:MFS transporter [Candidimonas nitroreducens]OWT61816.1 MFS transporter [Candidimonas nitroreducens]